MKAIRVHQPGSREALIYEDVPDPTPGPGEALVRIEAAGVNFVDVYWRTGAYQQPLPVTLGQEAAGTVVGLGHGVTEVKAGDRVGLYGSYGSYAELTVVPAQRLIPIPDGVSTRDAAAALLQGMTAHYLATDTFPLGSGHTCLIQAAAGGVGLLFCQIAHLRGARVIGTTSTEAKAHEAREAGADEVILYTEKDYVEETRRLTDGKGLDVIYDSVGKTTFLPGFDLLKPRGMMVLFGQSSGAVDPVPPSLLQSKGSIYLTRPTLQSYVITRDELLNRAAEVLGWVQTGQLKLKVHAEYPLADAARAHAALENRESTGKLLLIP
ncbi:MAG: zinc-binding dehydrogenase [Dehalococcoidia bacterium]|nr:zinc-binding dehydrogenase [Dehalococcoidia bacterium]